MIIITSNKPGAENWSGNEFSKQPCKIFSTPSEALESINNGWYSKGFDGRKVIIASLPEKKIIKLIDQGKAKWY